MTLIDQITAAYRSISAVVTERRCSGLAISSAEMTVAIALGELVDNRDALVGLMPEADRHTDGGETVDLERIRELCLTAQNEHKYDHPDRVMGYGKILSVIGADPDQTVEPSESAQDAHDDASATPAADDAETLTQHTEDAQETASEGPDISGEGRLQPGLVPGPIAKIREAEEHHKAQIADMPPIFEPVSDLTPGEAAVADLPEVVDDVIGGPYPADIAERVEAIHHEDHVASETHQDAPVNRDADPGALGEVGEAFVRHVETVEG